MPPLVFALVACAAVLHATWNVILKSGGDPLRTSLRLNVVSVAVTLPVALIAWVGIGAPGVPLEAIGLALVSGGLEFLYFVFLSAAYRRGELSVVYPIARGTAPLLAVVVGVAVLGERLGTAGAAGVAVLLAGILVLQRPWRAPWRAIAGRGAGASRGAGAGVGGAGAFALATGVVIACYSAIDRVGARLVEPWLYGAMLFTVCAVLLVGWVALLDVREAKGRAADGRAAKAREAKGRAADDRVGARGYRAASPATVSGAPWPAAAAAGLVATAAYLLVLGAYTLAPLSVVAPLRESAVVLVSGWGSFRLGEAANRGDAVRRLGGAGLVLLGAVLLALE